MKFFKSRAGAAIIMALVILLSTAYSVHRSLGAACQEITDGFYDGVYDEDWGAKHKSIASQLSARVDAAQGVISLAESYDELTELTDALKQARYDLIEAEDISGKFDANHALGEAFDAMSAPLRAAGLSDRGLTALQEYEYRFSGAQDTIDGSMYNDSVREFERSTLNVFPTNLLRIFVASDIPEKFE